MTVYVHFSFFLQHLSTLFKSSTCSEDFFFHLDLALLPVKLEGSCCITLLAHGVLTPNPSVLFKPRLKPGLL